MSKEKKYSRKTSSRFMEESQYEHKHAAAFKDPLVPEAESINRDEFALEALTRYSNTPISDFQPFILLTNFPHYVKAFAARENVEITFGPVLNVAHCKEQEMSIIDYQLGAPMAALVIDLLSYINPQCVIMLGLCGGLHRSHRIGDFLLPMAAIRDEGASRHYMPAQVPSLPAFMVQSFISQALMKKRISFKTGVIHTTDYRMWEFDEAFITNLKLEKATAIDMECSALFTAGFKRKVPVGSLLLISDLPLNPGGNKTKELSERVFKEYRDLHIECGIDALQYIRRAAKIEHINFRRFHFYAEPID